MLKTPMFFAYTYLCFEHVEALKLTRVIRINLNKLDIL